MNNTLKLKYSDVFLPPDLRMLLIGNSSNQSNFISNTSNSYFQITGSPRSGKSVWMKKLLSNISQMRPDANYVTILYCNPNLKSLSAKDKKFTEEFQAACKDIPVEFLPDLPTTEKLTSLRTNENARAFIVIGKSNF